jgi:hypothetical protein
MATVLDELSSLVTQMNEHDQLRVLEFARMLANPPVFPHTPLPPGTPGHVVAQLRVSPEVADALEAGHAECERIIEDD